MPARVKTAWRLVAFGRVVRFALCAGSPNGGSPSHVNPQSHGPESDGLLGHRFGRPALATTRLSRSSMMRGYPEIASRLLLLLLGGTAFLVAAVLSGGGFGFRKGCRSPLRCVAGMEPWAFLMQLAGRIVSPGWRGGKGAIRHRLPDRLDGGTVGDRRTIWAETGSPGGAWLLGSVRPIVPVRACR